MKIITPKEKYIFIELNKNDMKRLNLNYADMDYSNQETRNAIFSVLDCARASLGQSFELSDTLRVEALPRDDGGCLLFFTIGRKNKCFKLVRKESEITYLFKNIDAFLDLAASKRMGDFEKTEASLYLHDGKYYLRLKGRLSHGVIALMNEFAQSVKSDELPAFSENECVKTGMIP